MTACRKNIYPPQFIPQNPQNSREPLPSRAITNSILTEQITTPKASISVPTHLPTITSTPIPLPSIPELWDLISEDFESGTLDFWGLVSENDLSLVSDLGNNGSTALSVTVDKREAYIYKTEIAKKVEGYLTFWFNPNSVNIPDQSELSISGKSLRIVDIKGSQNYTVIAALRIWKPTNSENGYKAFLEWQSDNGSQFDLDSGQFDLINGWQKITLGYRINDWVAVWVNDAFVTQRKGINHSESYGEIIEIGKANDDASIIPDGKILYDDLAYQFPRITDLWVDSANGKDDNTGLELNQAFRTIQNAANLAGSGTKVHILPGVYRESINPTTDGSPAEPSTYIAESGAGTVIIRGSESSRGLIWNQLQSNTIGLPLAVDPSQIYYTDLSSWKLDRSPRFIIELDIQGNVRSRLALAHEPDFSVDTEWKYHEFWWSADGGSGKAACNPALAANPTCDYPSWSMTQLTDSTDDANPQGIEPGNLSTLGDLTGATLVAVDTVQGHYVYRRMIINHDIPAGRITVDQICEHDDGSGIPGLGWGTKYYVEGKPSLLDNPGEWWYDNKTGILYLWSPTSTSPANLDIEISRLENGFNLSQRSNLIVDGLTLEYFNGSAIYGYNESDQRSFNNIVQNVTLRYANNGVYLFQSVGDNPENITRDFVLEQSEIAYIDTNAINLFYYWKDESTPASFTFPGITNTIIRGNQLHHLGFQSDRDNTNGVSFERPDRIRFEGNHIHHVAHNGVQFSWSIIQSQKPYDFSPDEIKIGDILVKDNIFEQACQLTTDCAGLKFWGDPPNGHVFRNVLITGNIFRNTFGWTYVSEARRRWIGGSQSDVQGMGGFGLYLDMVSGFQVYRNIAYNNAYAGFYIYGVWPDGENMIINNIAANSLYGISFGGSDFDLRSKAKTQVLNNIMINNEAHGLRISDLGNFSADIFIDYNLYDNNGWRSNENGGVFLPGAMVIHPTEDTTVAYQTLVDIQISTSWEANGIEGYPDFVQYDITDHDINDGSWPDFNITSLSNMVIDRGTENLPESLSILLEEFGVQDQRNGTAFDIGRYELID